MSEDEDTRLDTRSIWLLLLREGGHWSVAEIARMLCADVDQVCRYVGVMTSRGYLRRRSIPEKKKEYSVDRNCKIPLGLAISDLFDAGVEA